MPSLPLQFLLILALAAGSPSPPREVITATFIGNQAFKITDGETTLFTDFPYESGAYGYMTWDEDSLEPVPDSLCLITHRHRDHFAPELVGKLGCTVIGPPSVVALVDDADAVAVDSGATAIGPLTVVPLNTPHSVDHRSYRVDWGEVSLYFTGDTETADVLAAQPPLDVLFTSPWLFDSAQRRGELPGVRRVVIYHHRDGQQIPACRPCHTNPVCIPCTLPRQGRVFELTGE